MARILSSPVKLRVQQLSYLPARSGKLSESATTWICKNCGSRPIVQQSRRTVAAIKPCVQARFRLRNGVRGLGPRPEGDNSPAWCCWARTFFACTVVLVCTDDNFSQLLSFSLNNLRISGRAFHETLTFQEVWRRFLARPQNALKNRRRP